MPDLESDFDLAAYYLNQRRLAELAGPDAIRVALDGAGSGISMKAQNNIEIAACKDVLVGWLHANRDTVPPLEQLLLLERVQPGALFTVSRSFYCKNVRNRSGSKPATMHRKLQVLGGEVLLRFKLHRGHVAAGSPGDLLSGQAADLYVVGVVESFDGSVLEAIPIFIGKAITRTRQGPLLSNLVCEVHADHIDSFARCADEPLPDVPALKGLRDVPEEAVKNAFAEIIGEPIVPKDWGGERSDLFTSHLRLEGRRISAAFIFKGPSRWRPMSFADLGKRGDQIVRLMTEPADLFVLQHCHHVREEVRHVLRTYALHYRRKCCVITGRDTVRILRAYSKCGYSPSPPSSAAQWR